MISAMRVLIVEDNPTDANPWIAVLQQSIAEVNIVHATTRADYLQGIESHPDIVLCEGALTRFDPLCALALLREREPNTPFLVLSGPVPVSTVVTFMKRGATDFVLEDQIETLPNVVAQALRDGTPAAHERRGQQHFEAALASTQRLRHEVLDSISSHIAVLDSDGRIQMVNRAWRRFAAENAASHSANSQTWDVGANYLDVCHRSASQRCAEAMDAYLGIEEVLLGRRDHFEQVYSCDSTTEKRWFQLSVSPLAKASGGVVVVHTNVTLQKNAEEIARATSEQLRLALTITRWGTWNCDLNNHRFNWSQEASAILGNCRPDMLETDPWGLVHPDDQSRVRAAFARSLTARQPFHEDFRVLGEQGEVRWLAARGQIHCNTNRLAISVMGILQDISDLRHAEQEAVARHLNDIARAAVAVKLNDGGKLDAVLRDCVAVCADSLGASSARVWLLDRTNERLDLLASAGSSSASVSDTTRSSHVPWNWAREVGHPYSHQLPDDSPVRETNWSMSQGWNGCFCHVLQVDGQVLGVLTVHALTAFPPVTVDTLRAIAELIAQFIHRRRTDAALAESEALYRATFDFAAVGIVHLEPSGRCLRVNRQLCENLGSSAEEIRRRNFIELLHPEDRAEHLALFQQLLGGDIATYHHESRYLGKDGKSVWVNATFSLCHDNAGNPSVAIGVLQDISDRKHVEEALRASEELYHATFDLAPVGIAHLSLRGQWLRTNRKMTEILGYTSEELLQLTFKDIVHPEDLDERTITARRLARGEIATRASAKRFLRRDGSVIWVNWNAAMQFDTKGKPCYAIVVVLDISERKRAEDERRDCEARYRAYIDNAADALLLYDVTGHVVDANQQACASLGYVRAELIGKMPHEFDLAVSPDSWSVIDPKLATEQPIDFETRFRRKDGSTFPVEVRWGSFTVHGARYALATARDTSARQRAELALRHRETRFRAILDQAIDPLFMIDVHGRVTETNRQACETLGYEREQLLSMNLRQINTAIEEVRLSSILPRSCLRPGQVSSVETHLRRRDGAVFPVELRVCAVRIVDEPFFVVVARDITERQGAERAIQEMNADLEQRVAARTEELARLVAILDASSDLIMINEIAGPMVFCNAAVRRFAMRYGIEPHDIKLAQLLPVDSLRKILEEGIPHALREGIWLGETVVFAPDGGIVPMSHLIQIHKNSANVSARYITTVMRDITQLKNLEQELREHASALSKANAAQAKAARMKDEFLANMSHELRTPLNGILGLCEALTEGVYGSLPANQKAAVQDVETCGRHLLTLINDILDLSKIEAGKANVEQNVVEVAALCHSSLRMIKEMALRKQLHTSLTIDSALVTMVADARKLKQILVNLLSNAVKFTPQGGHVSLDVTLDQQRESVRFMVSDTGIGISAENLKTLFQPFVQLDSSLSRQYSGTGLGLALVRRLTELHGGSLEVDSEPGKGSRFSVRIPWLTIPAIETSSPPVPERLVRQVVVVEDNDVAARQLVRYLAEWGVRAVIHPRALGLPDLIRHERPDLILLDLLLPDGDGWQVLATLKADQHTRDIPVLVVSELDEHIQGIKKGAVGYVVKPIDRAQLRSTLARAGICFPESPIASASDAPELLLAEDDEVNARTFIAFLTSTGYRVSHARTGVEALEKVRRFKPALVIMDIQMPGMDGLEAIRLLREEVNGKEIPVIALTALAMPGDRERCLEAGANEYLSKPVSLRLLHDVVDRLLAAQGKDL